MAMDFFKSVVGQEHIVNRLTRLAREGTLPHSLMLYGEEGLGKLDVAIGLGSYLLGRQIFSPDGGTEFLQRIHDRRVRDGESEKAVLAEGLPIYIDKGEAFWLRPQKSQFKVDQWYTLLRDYLQTASGHKRVVIVEDFQKANAIMANAMLKTIEEPPEGVYFILLTTQFNAVLPTIKSRCMNVSFQPLSNDVIRHMIEDELRRVEDGHVDYHKEIATRTIDVELIVSLSHGNPKLARFWLAQESSHLLKTAFTVMREMVKKGPFFTTVSLSLELLSKDELLQVFSWLRQISRDMVALRYGAKENILQFPNYIDSMLEILPLWSNRGLFEIIPLTLDGERGLQLNVKTTMVVSQFLIALRRVIMEDRR